MERYVENAKIYYNTSRLFNSTTRQTARIPDADGYYIFNMCCEGKEVQVKTKNKDMATFIDYQNAPIVALVVKNGIVKSAYPAIAAEHNCEQSSVEHAIRTSITCAWEKGDSALWLRYFPQGSRKAGSRPTNSTFINRIAGELRLKK
jgi:hypothetical protein